jgi:hypothetical protein
MEDEIGRRVLPYEKQRKYIPAQIVAEYLRELFQLRARHLWSLDDSRTGPFLFLYSGYRRAE